MLSALYYALRVCLFLAFLVFVPLGAGLLFFRKNQRGTGITYLFGILVLFALFEIIYLPFLFTTRRLSHLAFTFLPVVLALASAGFLMFRRNKLPLFQKPALNKKERTLLIILAALVTLQALRMVVCFSNMTADDSFYLAESIVDVNTDYFFSCDAETGAAGSIATNYQYSLAPWPVFLAVFSYAFGIHPAILIRTILPAPITLLFYLVTWLMFDFLFHGNREKVFLALIITVFYTYFLSSELAVKYFWLSFLPWYGKAVAPSIICPAALLFLMLAAEEKNKTERRVLWLGVFFGAVAACMVAATGPIVLLIMLACWGLATIIKNRDFSLIWKLAVCAFPCIAQIAAIRFL